MRESKPSPGRAIVGRGRAAIAMRLARMAAIRILKPWFLITEAAR